MRPNLQDRLVFIYRWFTKRSQSLFRLILELSPNIVGAVTPSNSSLAAINFMISINIEDIGILQLKAYL